MAATSLRRLGGGRGGRAKASECARGCEVWKREWLFNYFPTYLSNPPASLPKLCSRDCFPPVAGAVVLLLVGRRRRRPIWLFPPPASVAGLTLPPLLSSSTTTEAKSRHPIDDPL